MNPPAPLPWTASRVAEAAALPGLRIELVESIGSTSVELAARPVGDAPAAPVLLAAREQTAGRGRRGRPWSSDPDASLTFSVAVERAVDARTPPAEALPLALGVAIAEALEPFGARCALKWPNDLQLDGRKAGGLLVEARRVGGVERTVVGLGLNLLPDARVEAEAGQPVAALFGRGAAGDREAAAGPGTGAGPGRPAPPLPDRSVLLGALAGAIVRAWSRCAADGFAPFRAAWSARDALVGREVRIVELTGESWGGAACGIDDAGRLQVRTSHGVRAVLAAEVSVRAR